MKRSEAISIIQKSLESNGEGYYSNTASDILDALLKVRFDPPERMLPLKYDNRGKQLQVEYTRTWEPE